MNPRRVHELMARNFPETNAASRTWQNLMDRELLRMEVLKTLIMQHISDDYVLVEVHRKLGDYLLVEDAVQFISQHIGEGEIKVADREFNAFVVIARNGVATGWTAMSNASVDADASHLSP